MFLDGASNVLKDLPQQNFTMLNFTVISSVVITLLIILTLVIANILMIIHIKKILKSMNKDK